jgi:hypothetical protein
MPNEHIFNHIVTTKGSSGIEVNKYTFRYVKGRSTLRCTHKNCNATSQIVDNIAIVNGQHNHPSTLNKNEMRLDSRRKTASLAVNTCLKPNEIIRKVSEGMDNIQIKNLQTEKSLKNIIREERGKTNGNINEKNKINETYFKTNTGEKFIQFHNENSHYDDMVIICNDKRIIHLMNSEVWMGDGTFTIAPKNYTQIYTIHCKIFNKFFPTVYIFLKDKKTTSYQKAFEFLASLTRNKGPEYFIVDFERAPIKAFKNAFNNVKIG